MSENIHTVNFKTHIHLKSIIGKDLINNDNIAILELVKNSFDAQAKNVDIIFENIQTDNLANSRLIIVDDGIGMSFSDIKTKWLNIAYSEKKKEHTKNGRMMAGAKGVGRFSCDRLGEQLKLYTRTKGDNILLLKINWNAFEVENEQELEIQQIDLTCRIITDAEFFHAFERKMLNGTLLEITHLRSAWSQWSSRKKEWSREPLLNLRRYLEKLASPSAAFSKETFQLRLHAIEFLNSDIQENEHQKINGVIQNKIFEKLPYTTTVIQSEITTDNKIVTTLTDKNRQIIKITEKNYLKNLKGLRISIYYLNPYAKAYFTKQTGIRSVDYGSIFLFVNGFRVSGLGDSGNDWLRMEVRKTQGYARNLGTREVVGRIEITDPNQKIKIVSSREGVVTDNVTRQIIDVDVRKFNGFFYKTLRRLERYVVFGLEWDKTDEKTEEIESRILKSKNWKYNPLAEKYEKSQSEKDKNLIKVIQPIVEQNTRPENILDVEINLELLADVKDAADQKSQEKFNTFVEKHHIDLSKLDAIKKLQDELKKTTSQKNKAKQKAEEEEHRRKKVEEELERATGENLFLKSTRSKSSKEILALQHQIGHSSDRIARRINSMKSAIDSQDTRKLKSDLNIIHLENQIISSVVNFVTQANFNLKTKKQSLDLVKFISDYIENVYSAYKHLKINNEFVAPHVHVQEGLKFILKFRPLEVIILIDNLFHNAHKASAQNMYVDICNENNDLIITFTDDGRGIAEADLDKIFDYGFTKTDGTGLGLYHAKEIAKKLTAQILAESTDDGAKFTLKVTG